METLTTRIHACYSDFSEARNMSQMQGSIDAPDGHRERVSPRIVCVNSERERQDVILSPTGSQVSYRIDLNEIHQFGKLRDMSLHQVDIACDNLRMHIAARIGATPSNLVIDPFVGLSFQCLSKRFRQNLIRLLQNLSRNMRVFLRFPHEYLFWFVPWNELSNHAIIIFSQPRDWERFICSCRKHKIPSEKTGIELEFMPYRSHEHMVELNHYPAISYVLTTGIQP